MTYVTDMDSEELRAHMVQLQKMPGWHDPLSDRLAREIERQAAEIERLRDALQNKISTISDRAEGGPVR